MKIRFEQQAGRLDLQPIVEELLQEFYRRDRASALWGDDTWFGNAQYDLNLYYPDSPGRRVALYPVETVVIDGETKTITNTMCELFTANVVFEEED